jgi:hypothetical protein
MAVQSFSTTALFKSSASFALVWGKIVTPIRPGKEVRRLAAGRDRHQEQLNALQKCAGMMDQLMRQAGSFSWL